VGGTQRQGIYQGVAWVIANRMNNLNGTYGRGREALFRNQQFRSSFGGCDVAQRDAFLCPTSLGSNWADSWNLARTSVANTRRTNNNPLAGVHHYYFGQHFNTSTTCARWKGVRPSWAVGSARRNPDLSSLKAESDCLEFYEVC
jgi:hypothetical protein